MNTPLELLPLRPAVRSDAATSLDLLIRIVPPSPSGPAKRPALNLGLVLDHSGSMAGGRKMEFAKQAAVFAVQQLLPEDRVSLTIFDDTVKTLTPSTPATDKARLVELINRVEPAGSTALHAGWQAGAGQVAEHLLPEGLNRVLLLTDGLANVGETNADNICTDVKKRAVTGVSTTAMGVGNDYNEDLLEAMARSGDGNYYYIESPRQLADIFQTELMGLMATVGHKVLLSVETLAGVSVEAVLNDLNRDPEGRLVLPNLIVGLPVHIVIRLRVPPQSGPADLCGFRLTWQDARQGEQFQTATLRLPAVGAAEWEALVPRAEVAEQGALQAIGQRKREATRCLERGDLAGARNALAQCRQMMDGLPRTALVEQEDQDLAVVQERLEAGDFVGTAKAAKYQHYRRSHSRPQT